MMHIPIRKNQLKTRVFSELNFQGTFPQKYGWKPISLKVVIFEINQFSMIILHLVILRSSNIRDETITFSGFVKYLSLKNYSSIKVVVKNIDHFKIFVDYFHWRSGNFSTFVFFIGVLEIFLRLIFSLVFSFVK